MRFKVIQCSWLFAVAGGCISPVAVAVEGDSINYFVGGTLTRDDNVFRSPSFVSPVADSIYSTYAGISMDTQVSLQHFHVEIFGNNSRYDKLSYLDNTGSRYQAGWQGLLLDKLKTDASWNRSETLAGFADSRSTIKNIVTSENSTLRLQYPVTPDWSFFAVGGYGSSTNGAAFNAVSDSRNRSAELGAKYDTPLGNSLGISTRTSNGRYPNRQVLPGSIVDNSYRQQDIEASLSWVFSGLSRFDLRCAQTEREHNDVPQRDFKGVTGSASWGWTPSAMSSLNVYLRRELGSSDYLQANYSVVRTFGLTPRWNLTPKISLQGLIERRDRTFGGDPQFAIFGAPVSGDVLRSTSFSAQYAATSEIQLSVSARREARDSTDPALPYVANVLSLSAQLMF